MFMVRAMSLELLKFLARYKGEDKLVKLVTDEIGLVCQSGVQSLQARLQMPDKVFIDENDEVRFPKYGNYPQSLLWCRWKPRVEGTSQDDQG